MSASSMPITELLASARAGHSAALAEAYAMVVDELRQVASAMLRREDPGHTLQPTALVHEAYLKLSRQHSIGVADRDQFLLVAAQAMRRILVDHARRRSSLRRGGGQAAAPAMDLEARIALPAIDLLALDEALERLRANEPRLAQLVELRFFAGLGAGETAQVLGVSRRTCERDWLLARAFLRRQMAG